MPMLPSTKGQILTRAEYKYQIDNEKKLGGGWVSRDQMWAETLAWFSQLLYRIENQGFTSLQGKVQTWGSELQ